MREVEEYYVRHCERKREENTRLDHCMDEAPAVVILNVQIHKHAHTRAEHRAIIVPAPRRFNHELNDAFH